MNNPIVLILFYVVIIGGFWWLLMRPQKKEQKRVQLMLSELAVGDTVLTTSGFYGVVIDITDEDVIVEFGSNKNCRIPMQNLRSCRLKSRRTTKSNFLKKLKKALHFMCNAFIIQLLETLPIPIPKPLL